MSANYYIYYKVPVDSRRVKSAVAELQRSLLAKTGVTGRLLCRRDEPRTWMEVYESIPDPEEFHSVLVGELERLHFDELLGRGSSRQTEVFRSL